MAPKQQTIVVVVFVVFLHMFLFINSVIFWLLVGISCYNSRDGAKTKADETKGGEALEAELVGIPTHRELPYLFEKELINNQNKHIHIMDEFGPSRNIHHLSSKFYARHERSIPKNYASYVPFVQGSAHKYNTTNNVYGWMPETVKSPGLLKQLNFINAPKQRCCLTVYGERLRSDKANERAAFNGVRFFLQ